MGKLKLHDTVKNANRLSNQFKFCLLHLLRDITSPGFSFYDCKRRNNTSHRIVLRVNWDEEQESSHPRDVLKGWKSKEGPTVISVPVASLGFFKGRDTYHS